jgi:hypothetical protein
MTKNIGHEVCHIFRQGIGTAPQHRQCTRTLRQIDRGPRTCTKRDEPRQILETMLVGRTGCRNQAYSVLNQGWIHVHVAAFTL